MNRRTEEWIGLKRRRSFAKRSGAMVGTKCRRQVPWVQSQSQNPKSCKKVIDLSFNPAPFRTWGQMCRIQRSITTISVELWTMYYRTGLCKGGSGDWAGQITAGNEDLGCWKCQDFLDHRTFILENILYCLVPLFKAKQTVIFLLLLFLFSFLFVLFFRLLWPLIATKEQKVLKINKTNLHFFRHFWIWPDLDVVADVDGVAHCWIPHEVGLGGVRICCRLCIKRCQSLCNLL